MFIACNTPSHINRIK
ncbi:MULTISPECIES: hypothetical protein [unclassified Bartonella]